MSENERREKKKCPAMEIHVSQWASWEEGQLGEGPYFPLGGWHREAVKAPGRFPKSLCSLSEISSRDTGAPESCTSTHADDWGSQRVRN